MYYCFVEEDLRELEDKDPFSLQASYARFIKQYCMLKTETGSITGATGEELAIEGEKVFLRASCTQMEEAMKILKEKGAILFEKEQDVLEILHWNEHNQTKRKVLSVHLRDLKKGACGPELESLLKTEKLLFLKSMKKGFCLKVSGERLLKKDIDVLAFLEEKCALFGEELLISPYLSIKKDSLGKKESRHVVIEGNILNSSRPLHSLVHAVPKSQIKKAEEAVKKLAEIEGFPLSYVLDIGEFENDGEKQVDIVEINPLTSSMCYVNNSIFGSRKGVGLEYEFDSRMHPDRYVTERIFGMSYEYDNKEHYEFT